MVNSLGVLAIGIAVVAITSVTIEASTFDARKEGLAFGVSRARAVLGSDHTVIIGGTNFSVTRPSLITSTGVATLSVGTLGIGTTSVGVGATLVDIVASFAIAIVTKVTSTCNTRKGRLASGIGRTMAVLWYFSNAVITRGTGLTITRITFIASTSVASFNVLTNSVGIAGGCSSTTLVDIVTSLSITSKTWLASTLDSRESGFASSVW